MKRWIFRLLGKDPEPFVVSFASGPPELVAAMFAEIQGLVTDRRHILITTADCPDSSAVRRRLRGVRIAIAPVLFNKDPEYRWLRRTAFLLAPTKILAYNSRLERHHLKLATWIASLLFLRGVALDRIFLRPSWLVPWKKDRTEHYPGYREEEGRAFAAGRPRVGVVTPYFPYPLSHGGAVRMHALIREMAATFDVVLFAFDEDGHTDASPMQEFCGRIFLVRKPRYREPRWSSLEPPEVAEYRSSTMRHLVVRMRRELGLDLLQVEYTMLAAYGGDILVEHDVTYALYRQIHERERTLASWWDWWRWRRFERRWVEWYRRTVVMSDADTRLLDCGKAVVIPNGVDLSRFEPQAESPGEELLFIGSFRHFPNIVAFRFFFEQVWPLLPGTRLVVVAGPDPLLYWAAHTGSLALPASPLLTLHGFVGDVRPLYWKTNLVLAPTLVSAGTNLKVIEALAMERATVTTSSGCGGLGLTHGENVWVADDRAEFAEGVRGLLDDAALRGQIAKAGRRFAQEHFDWRQIGSKQRAMMLQMIPSRLIFRPAQMADLDAIVAIQHTSPEASQWLREDYLNFDCMVAERDGTVVGFLVSRDVGGGEREILNVAVHEDFRRLGIGSQLLKEEIAARRGTHFLEVRGSNAAARALYGKLGFLEVGIRPGYYEDPPEAGIVMKFVS